MVLGERMSGPAGPGSWRDSIESIISACPEVLTIEKPRGFQVESLPRLAERVEDFSQSCADCQRFGEEIRIDSHLFHQEGLSDRDARRRYSIGMAGVIHHLRQKHGVIRERYYVRRLVTLAATSGLAFISLGWALLYLGFTAVVFAFALPAFVGRCTLSYLAGLLLDWRAKKKGIVI